MSQHHVELVEAYLAPTALDAGGTTGSPLGRKELEQLSARGMGSYPLEEATFDGKLGLLSLYPTVDKLLGFIERIEDLDDSYDPRLIWEFDGWSADLSSMSEYTFYDVSDGLKEAVEAGAFGDISSISIDLVDCIDYSKLRYAVMDGDKYANLSDYLGVKK